MGIDAVVLLRPKDPALLKGVLDPETESVDVLDDGSLLLSTFVRYRDIENDLDAGRAILTGYGQALVDAHDDDRGILFFPDIAEPRGRTYDAVVAEVGEAGTWIPARILTEEEQAARTAEMTADVNAMVAAAQALQRGEPLASLNLDPRIAAAFEPRPMPSLEDLQAQMAALLSKPEVIEAFGAAMAMGCAALVVQRPSKKPLAATYAGLGVNEMRQLDDGSFVVLTNRGGQDGPEMVALALGEQLSEWAAEHRDPRGVPTFQTMSLDAIEGAKSYEEALALLGDEVTFVRPHTIEDVIAERKARFRDLLG